MWSLRNVQALVGGGDSTPKVERRLLLKVDALVLSFVCLNYWINYINRSNVANAYVSGMKEDLGMMGNELNIINTCFTVGYLIGMIPNNLILLRVRPRYWLSFCCFSWGILTLSMYRVTSYKQLCIIRFFQALFEASTFSGTHLILGSWYKEEEIAKRAAIFTSSGLLGSIFSGFLQSTIYRNLDGARGLLGWRWLFIVDALITLPIAAYGLIFPDTPELCSSRYFTAEERELAVSRLSGRRQGRAANVSTRINRTLFKRVVGRWHWWMLSLLWAVGAENESFSINSLFSLWLADQGYSVIQRNQYPMGIYGVGIFFTVTCALYVDACGGKNHHHVAYLSMVVLVICSVLLLVRPLSVPYVFAAHYLSGIGYAGQAVYFSWANIVCQNDLQERAIVLASMNMFSGALNAWWSIVFYSASSVPYFRHGCYAMIAVAVTTSGIAFAILRLQRRENRLVPELTEDGKSQ